MASSSTSSLATEMLILPEPQCLKHIIDIERCSKPLEKKISACDTSDDSFTLRKTFVRKEWLPMLLPPQEDVKNGIPVPVFGPDGKEYEMTFSYNPRRDIYVLKEGWKKFADDYALISSEHFATVWMFRHKTSGKLCFAITFRHVPVVAPTYRANRIRASN